MQKALGSRPSLRPPTAGESAFKNCVLDDPIEGGKEGIVCLEGIRIIPRPLEAFTEVNTRLGTAAGERHSRAVRWSALGLCYQREDWTVVCPSSLTVLPDGTHGSSHTLLSRASRLGTRRQFPPMLRSPLSPLVRSRHSARWFESVFRSCDTYPSFYLLIPEPMLAEGPYIIHTCTVLCMVFPNTAMRYT